MSKKFQLDKRSHAVENRWAMHCKSFWINSFSGTCNDGWVCMACWDTCGADSGVGCLGHGKEGMAGWRWNHHGVGATVPLLTSVPCGSFFLENVHINTCTHIHTFMPVHKDTPLGFPLICWTWRLTQELAIEKAGPSFMRLTLVLRSIVKVINMEGEDQPLLFPLCAITPTVSSKHLL